MGTGPDLNARQRLDKWLFFSRLAKSRSLAQKAIEAGDVRLNGHPAKQSSQLVQAGDLISFASAHRDYQVKVLLPGSRRGPFEEARLLYEDLTPEKSEADDPGPVEQAVRERGAGRPTKRERRLTDRLFRRDED